MRVHAPQTPTPPPLTRPQPARADAAAVPSALETPGAGPLDAPLEAAAEGGPEALWEGVRARLRAELGDATFNSWLRTLTLVSHDGDRVTLAAPTRFQRDWVHNHYARRIEGAWLEVGAPAVAIDVVVAIAEPTPAAEGPAAVPAAPAARPESNVLGSTLEPRCTFDSFIVGKSNELAHAAARRVAESSEVQFNPLYLYGGVGLGKTHLMHAIAWHLSQTRPDRKVMYLSAEKFMFQFIRALRYKDTMAFKEQFRSVDVLMIDDVQFISGKDSTQEEFFHTFNALVDQNRQIVISGDRSPSDLDAMEERLRSRLGWGLVADIHPTDFELRLGILQSKVDQQEIDVPTKVIDFLAARITSNVRELEGALNRVTAYASLVGRPIGMDMVQEVLQDLLRANDRRVSMDDIKRRVADYYNVKLSDMDSQRRARAIARPRQVAMYLCKQLTPRSLPEIGRKFGGRDHTTVMHAVRKIEELRQTDSSMAEDLDLLKRQLEG